MAEQTEISYLDSTASPWTGCAEVSPGCANCYARQLAKRHGWCGWGRGERRHRFKGFEANARRWNAKAGRRQLAWDTFRANSTVTDSDLIQAGFKLPVRPRIFPSLCDWLDEEVPIHWLADFLKLIHDTPHLSWLLLTKRPGNGLLRLQGVQHALGTTVSDPGSRVSEWLRLWLNGQPPHHVWFGVSVEDQQRANERIPALLRIPAHIRWLSVEPLIGPVGFSLWHRDDDTHSPADLDWVVCGGESGPKARPCRVEWIRSIVQQCKAANVPCFVKQFSGHRPGQQGILPDELWNTKQFPAP